MQELDRLPNHVTLIAATNRLDMVDEAMMRRFSVRHEIKNMTTPELDAMIRKYLKATDTENYVSDNDIAGLTTEYTNPGQVMPELNKLIGMGIYEEKKDTLSEEPKPEENSLDLWEVTYTWKANISAETEEDAIVIGRHERNAYYAKGANEEYSAKRAEFIAPVVDKK